MGRARRHLIYTCTKCPYEGRKQAAEWHYLKMHVQEHRVPFWCGLCQYRATSIQQLEKHVTGFKAHKMRKEATNRVGSEDSLFFMKSNNPYEVSFTEDVIPLSPGESTRRWKMRREGRNSMESLQVRVEETRETVPPSSTPPDILYNIMKECGLDQQALFNEDEFIPDYDDILFLPPSPETAPLPPSPETAPLPPSPETAPLPPSPETAPLSLSPQPSVIIPSPIVTLKSTSPSISSAASRKTLAEIKNEVCGMRGDLQHLQATVEVFSSHATTELKKLQTVILKQFSRSTPAAPHSPKTSIGTISSYALQGLNEMWEDVRLGKDKGLFPYRTRPISKYTHHAPAGYRFKNYRF